MAEWQLASLTVEGLDALNTDRTRQIWAHVTFGPLASWRKSSRIASYARFSLFIRPGQISGMS
jgi:hypothetical protein